MITQITTWQPEPTKILVQDPVKEGKKFAKRGML